MPRREKDRELARNRKRKKERQKLRAKGLLPPVETFAAPNEAEKMKVKKEAPKEGTPEAPMTAPEPAKAEG